LKLENVKYRISQLQRTTMLKECKESSFTKYYYTERVQRKFGVNVKNST